LRGYNPSPRYALALEPADVGYEALAGARGAVALDGPAAAPWDAIAAAFPGSVDVRTLPAWDELGTALAGAVPHDDPVFAPLHRGELRDLFKPARDGAAVLFGPGSSLAGADETWLVGYPKRFGLELVRSGAAGNLGTPAGEPGTEQRLVFVDWPILERHHQRLVCTAERYLDVTDPASPRSISGDNLRASLAAVARRPFRTVPSFLPGPWGGQWLRDTLGIETDEVNLAWSYELIAPEAGIDLEGVEVPFELLLADDAGTVMGLDVAARFGRSFPIRFDYLDTYGGGNLSLQCHPTREYALAEFALPYTQEESYYVVETSPGGGVYLGLQEEADVAAFEAEAAAAAEAGAELHVERYAQLLPAAQHRLYLIPPGTLHASGAGNVVLEISATPYFYTLRFYDWLRHDLAGELRPVHLRHAFANLDETRRGVHAVTELVQEPQALRSGDGWGELVLGRREDLLFAVHRLDFDDEIDDDTDGRFHMLNLVAGSAVEIETSDVVHSLAYGESLVIPAVVGPYRVRGVDGSPFKVVKAFVP
jgi:mannose-6-phosphate isomerase class I